LTILRIARFVDRDMVMRYHWGLAVGHTYAHEAENTDSMEIHPADHCDMEEAAMNSEAEEQDSSDKIDARDDSSEYTLGNRDEDLWDHSSASEFGDSGPDRLCVSDVEGDVSDDEFVSLTFPRFGPRFIIIRLRFLGPER
jgi:hypothetical protein